MKFVVIIAAVLLQYTTADDVTVASNRFSAELYRELAKTPGNVLVCPLSVHIALALVHQGAGGSTANELAQVLHLSGSNAQIKNSYQAMLSGLKSDVLKIATKLFPANNFQPNVNYVSLAQQYFLSDVQALDYSKADAAANTINNYVEEKTNNKIHDIIKPDSLSELTRLVIVNAVHFKAGWAKPFPPSFTDDFKVSPTESVKTDFLDQTDYFSYKEDRALGAKVLKMDYMNEEYSMVIVLPNKDDGLQEVEAKLVSTSMDNLLKGMQELRVQVTIPKFKIEQQMQLKDILIKMGIRSIFDSRADLRGISDGESLAVDSIIQKTFIDVNEKGTEAAAATGVVTPLSGGTEENIFLAKKPFHFYLIHNKPPFVILFSGKLVRPEFKEKTPTQLSSKNPTDKQKGNSNTNKNDGLDRNGGLNYYNAPQTRPGLGEQNAQPSPTYIQNPTRQNFQNPSQTQTNWQNPSQTQTNWQNPSQPQTNWQAAPGYNQIPNSPTPQYGYQEQTGYSQQPSQQYGYYQQQNPPQYNRAPQEQIYY